jgi:cell division protein FtsB
VGDERAKARGERPRRTPPQRRSGVGTPRRRGREPQLTRIPSARVVVAATTDLLGLSSARRAAVLAIVVCALALTVAVPLRNYVSQRQELAAVVTQQQALAAEVAELSRERARLSDPAEIQAQARSRLGYAMPGEVPYVVQPPAGPDPAYPNGPPGTPWYRVLWREVAEGPR